MPLRTFLAAAMATVLLSAAPAVAQDGDNAPTLTVTEDVLQQGGSATIHYSNPAMAGQTVVIDIDNGMRNNTQVTAVEIVLDDNGNGTATWTVSSSWFMANFNAPGAGEINRPIVP